jgi:glycosyltransferase involved in cell wall biosynthesis
MGHSVWQNGPPISGRSPLVSVLITSYNYAEFLPWAVESVAAQSFADIQLVIVDDGSTDGSCKYIGTIHGTYGTRFRHCRCVRLRANRGKLAALNVGIPLLHGEATVILDADDSLLSDYIDITLDQLQSAVARESAIGFVYTDCHLVDRKGTRLGRGRSTPFDAELLCTESYIPECAITLTTALRAILPLDESIRVGTKHHKWCRLTAAGYGGEYLARPLFNYRMHDRNLSGIGVRVLDEVRHGRPREKILSAYWTEQHADKTFR